MQGPMEDNRDPNVDKRIRREVETKKRKERRRRAKLSVIEKDIDDLQKILNDPTVDSGKRGTYDYLASLLVKLKLLYILSQIMSSEESTLRNLKLLMVSKLLLAQCDFPLKVNRLRPFVVKYWVHLQVGTIRSALFRKENGATIGGKWKILSALALTNQ